MTTYIHIHAKCPYFEIFELVPEKKAEGKLTAIRKNFEWYNTKSNMKLPHGEANLVVKTIVNNPTLF